MENTNNMKRIAVIITVFLLVISFCGNTVAVAAQTVGLDNADSLMDVSVPLSTVKSDSNCDISYPFEYGGKNAVLKWAGQNGKAEFEVDVLIQGDYYIELTYMPIIDINRSIELSLQVDGVYINESGATVKLPCIYKTEKRKTDNVGNDSIPKSIKEEKWNRVGISDPEGLNNGPLLIHFEKGKHTISIVAEMAAFYIADITLKAPTNSLSYDEYIKNYKKQDVSDSDKQEIIIQGEDALYKSDSSLIPGSDRSSVATMPSSPSVDKLNIISSSQVGQWLEWEFDVKKSGFYNFGLRFQQSSLRGFSVTRRIYIDGEVPFDEFSYVTFGYDNDWKYKDIGEPYLIYLDEGKHTVRMEVVLGDFSEIILELSEVVKEMNSLYRKIIMITGTSPDSYRDYRLENQIDGFCDTLFGLAERIEKCGNKLDAIAGKEGGESAFLYEIADQLNSIGENPETMASRLDKYSSNISSLSSWLNDKKIQPLTIDYLRFSSNDMEAPNANANFFDQLWYRMKFILNSFVKDYTSVGNVYQDGENKALEVWMSGGSEYAKVAKNAIDDLFVPSTGINVNLRLVQVSIIIATFAGKGPDVSLNIDPTTIVNLAARGELVPLSDKVEYKDAIKNFNPELLVPLEHNGKCYGLPVASNNLMMFYRTDIFEELGLKAPENWQEFKEIVALLQSKNMQVGIPDLFTTLLLQQGIDVYNEDLSATNFEKAEAVGAFEEAMRYFTHTGLPDVFDFYNRFRSGEMPLGIQDIAQYNMLSTAAPEIKGLWEMVPIPGTVAEDGSIIRTQTSGALTAATLFSRAKNNDDAWTFLRWWTGAEAQTRYGSDLENTLGTAARYMAANDEVIKALPWSNKELDNIFAQREFLKGVPTLPASYYLNRGLTNAFRNVLYNNENPREALFYQNKQINKEITRKRKELNIE